MKKLILILFLIFPSTLLAQSYFIRAGTDSGTISVASGDTFSTRIKRDRSLYCRYKSSNVNVDWGLSTIVICGNAPCPTARQVGDDGTGVDAGTGPNDAVALIADFNGFGSDDNLNQYTFTVTLMDPSPSNIIIECYDSTLYGNFNTVTVANPFNFLELSNDSGIDIDARVTVVKNDGTVLSRTNISIPEGQQRDISIHDIAGASNTFGRIMVAHNGALHGLRAKITKYTSSFAITASEKFETRENEQ